MFRATGRNSKLLLIASILPTIFVPLQQAGSADRQTPMSRRHVIRPLDPHDPRNVSQDQFNSDGSRIFWTNTSNTRTVYFMSHSEMESQPNGCPVCATVQIELRVADGTPFQYKPTQSISDGCSASGEPPSFDVSSGFITLAPNSYYKWQARVIANYQWWVYDNGRSYCETRDTIYPSSWQVGAGFMVPGYFSFKSP